MSGANGKPCPFCVFGQDTCPRHAPSALEQALFDAMHAAKRAGTIALQHGRDDIALRCAVAGTTLGNDLARVQRERAAKEPR